jgi:myo-inositol-1(or 4)-monophosphatase
MSDLLRTALRAARAAGELIHRNFQRLAAADIQAKGRNDFVTRVDREAEAVIGETILARFPHHRMLAEEGGYSARRGDHLWVVDPLDGTTNFIHGIPHVAVSLALMEKGKVIFGLIHDPLAGESFHAEAGRGAFLNGRPIAVSRTAGLAAALGATGFPFKAPEQLSAYSRTFKALMSKCKDMRRCGSAALDLAYVACGRFDFFWEAFLLPWDFLAGKLLIAEAGGVSSDFAGRGLSLRKGTVLAANRMLYPFLAKEIGKYFK